MNFEELKNKYLNVPQELKVLKRWVCYRIEQREGKDTKVPVNAITGDNANCNDKSTWTTFDVAMKGVIKYHCEGIGFQLGDGVFGIDLDNHPDPKTNEKLPKDQFDSLCNEFIDSLDSYTEYSRSGEGIHIICYGTLPEGRRRAKNIEMYDCGRFFAFTGNAINNVGLRDRTDKIIPLWKKYVDDSERIKQEKIDWENKKKDSGNHLYDFTSFDTDGMVEAPALTDSGIIDKACASKTGGDFRALYIGDMSAYNNDHSAADMAFCSMLAFWCNGDAGQMDRIFRHSKLIREKWDSKRGDKTYGQITIETAIKRMQNGYVPMVRQRPFAPVEQKMIEKEKKTIEGYMNIGADGEPIFRLKTIVKDYEYTDTGNAERFYDYFGDLFKYNKDNKYFMFWTGKTWVRDAKDVIIKYANKLIEIMGKEVSSLSEEATEVASSDPDKAKSIQNKASACAKNVARLSNKSGKDAMISELQSIHDIPVRDSEFDSNPYLLNTDSGVVDLTTGKLQSFDKSLMLSKSTNIEVDFQEPVVWEKFLHDIFDRSTIGLPKERAEQETKEIVDCLQMCLGYSLTGVTREQVMFLMYGSGSNGKSTFAEEMAIVLGDYGKTIDSNLLMAQQNANTSIQFSLAELVGARYLVTKETDEGQKLAEGTVKSLTGSDQIQAQMKYGRPFQFMPQFKLWMMTNNLPVIRGTDFGIWRRIFLFPFLRHFTDEEKDMDMPKKLKAESARILGWCIKGYQAYIKQGRLVQPQCLKDALESYKEEMDVVSKFLRRECFEDKAKVTICTQMYKAFKSWAMDNNEYAMRESKFCSEMIKKGYNVVYPPKGEPYYVGIALNDISLGSSYDFRSSPKVGFDDEN